MKDEKMLIVQKVNFFNGTNIKKLCKLTKKKVLVIIVFLVLALQPRFSSHYKYIERQNILMNLFQKSNVEPDGAQRNYCKYGHIINNTTLLEIPKSYESDVDENQLTLGQYVPKDCIPLFSTAILVPYRNRKSQLDIFIPYMHKFLQKQNIHYKIFVIEQLGSEPWNKGKLFNAGAHIAMKLNFPCLILHDVDLLPLNPANIYACTKFPRHMSANIDKFRYNLPYDSLVGGALAITADHYITVNGYSNNFERWGGEDDDFSNRLANEDLPILRFPPDVSRYTMLKHKQETKNEHRHEILETNLGKHKFDGLSNLVYKFLSVSQQNLYTNISVLL